MKRVSKALLIQADFIFIVAGVLPALIAVVWTYRSIKNLLLSELEEAQIRDNL